MRIRRPGPRMLAMLQWADDLKIAGLELYLDSRRPRPLCFVSHAHSDHIGLHARSILTAPTARITSYRMGSALDSVIQPTCQNIATVECGESCAEIALFPAGHVLGSAMLRVRSDEASLLYTGDFKLRPSLTCEQAVPVQADFLVMESTYGLPQFRFPPWRAVADELIDRCAAAIQAGRQPIVMGYSLGKAQEITRILSDAGIPVTQHGACFAMTNIYEECGVKISTNGSVRRYAFDDFHGPAPLDLAERGVLVAPPSVARSSFVTRFDNPVRIMMSGWALLSGAIYRYGVDHALPLSDHADFDELLDLIDRVRPKKIFTHHGFPEFVDHLKSRGLDAELARPDPQGMLFG